MESLRLKQERIIKDVRIIFRLKKKITKLHIINLFKQKRG